MVVKKKYGDWKDPNNEYVKMIPYLDFFLDTYSESSKNPVFLQLVPFAIYCKETYNKGLLEVNGIETLSYLKNVIDKKDIEKKSKQRIRFFLKAYYNYVVEVKNLMEQETFRNPIPSSKIWSFSGNQTSLKELRFEIQVLKMEEIKQIIKHLYYTKPTYIFIALCLIIFTGARVSEVCQIELKNINLNSRWFITKVKSEKREKREGIYFYPDFFIPYLKRYIETVKIEYSNPKFLFPSNRSSSGHIIARTIQYYMKEIKNELGIKAKINPHSFRDFINTERKLKGCDKDFLTILLNQTVKDVNTAHYLKRYDNRMELRKVFDMVNPFNKEIMPSPKLF